MAEATQFNFTWAEVTTLLLKQQGIHAGEWFTVVEFAINAGILGPSPGDARPGAMLLATGLRLSKADAGTPPNLVVDAATVNPATESAA